MSSRDELPKQPGPSDPIRLEIKEVSNYPIISSPSGNRTVKILSHGVVVYDFPVGESSKKTILPKRTILPCENVKAVTFVPESKEQKEQVVCVTSKAVIVWNVQNPGEPVKQIQFQTPMAEKDSNYKACVLADDKTVCVISQTPGKTYSRYSQIGLDELKHDETVLEVVNYKQAIFAKSLRDSSILLFMKNDSSAEEQSRFYSIKLGGIAPLFASPVPVGEAITIYDIWTDNHLGTCAVGYRDEKSISTSLNVIIYKNTFTVQDELADKIDYKVRPLFLGKNFYYVKANTNQVWCHDTRNNISTLACQFSQTNPTCLFAAGEGGIGVEGIDPLTENAISEVYPLSLRIRTNMQKKLVSDVINSPDVSGLIMKYVGDDLLDLSLNMSQLESGEEFLRSVDADHSIFDDGREKSRLWYATSGNELKKIPLPDFEDRSQFVSLSPDQVARVSWTDQSIRFYDVKISPDELLLQRSKLLQISFDKKTEPTSTRVCLMPDNRIVVAPAFTKSFNLQVIDFKLKQEGDKKRVTNIASIAEVKFNEEITELIFVPPNFIAFKSHDVVFLFEVSTKKDAVFQPKDLVYKTAYDTQYFWITSKGQPLIFTPKEGLCLYQFDPKTMNLINQQKINIARANEFGYVNPFALPSCVGMLPDGGFLLSVQRSPPSQEKWQVMREVYDILRFDIKTSKLSLILSDVENPAWSATLLKNGNVLLSFYGGAYTVIHSPELQKLQEWHAKALEQPVERFALTGGEVKSAAAVPGALFQAPKSVIEITPQLSRVKEKLDKLIKIHKDRVEVVVDKLAKEQKLSLQELNSFERDQEIANRLSHLKASIAEPGAKMQECVDAIIKPYGLGMFFNGGEAQEIIQLILELKPKTKPEGPR